MGYTKEEKACNRCGSHTFGSEVAKGTYVHQLRYCADSYAPAAAAPSDMRQIGIIRKMASDIS